MRSDVVPVGAAIKKMLPKPSFDWQKADQKSRVSLAERSSLPVFCNYLRSDSELRKRWQAISSVELT